jgi:phospholipase A1
MGHGDIAAVYRNRGHEYSVLLRRNLHTNKGAVQLGWAWPIVGQLKGYTHIFTGYGQSLIDYNYYQRSIGFGVQANF